MRGRGFRCATRGHCHEKFSRGMWLQRAGAAVADGTCCSCEAFTLMPDVCLPAILTQAVSRVVRHAPSVLLWPLLLLVCLVVAGELGVHYAARDVRNQKRETAAGVCKGVLVVPWQLTTTECYSFLAALNTRPVHPLQQTAHTPSICRLFRKKIGRPVAAYQFSS